MMSTSTSESAVPGVAHPGITKEPANEKFNPIASGHDVVGTAGHVKNIPRRGYTQTITLPTNLLAGSVLATFDVGSDLNEGIAQDMADWLYYKFNSLSFTFQTGNRIADAEGMFAFCYIPQPDANGFHLDNDETHMTENLNKVYSLMQSNVLSRNNNEEFVIPVHGAKGAEASMPNGMRDFKIVKSDNVLFKNYGKMYIVLVQNAQTGAALTYVMTYYADYDVFGRTKDIDAAAQVASYEPLEELLGETTGVIVLSQPGLPLAVKLGKVVQGFTSGLWNTQSPISFRFLVTDSSGREESYTIRSSSGAVANASVQGQISTWLIFPTKLTADNWYEPELADLRVVYGSGDMQFVYVPAAGTSHKTFKEYPLDTLQETPHISKLPKYQVSKPIKAKIRGNDEYYKRLATRIDEQKTKLDKIQEDLVALMTKSKNFVSSHK